MTETARTPHYRDGQPIPIGKVLDLPGGMGKTRYVLRDGEIQWQFRCPLHAPGWGDIDDDQLHGRVSIQCFEDGCTFHETRNVAEELNLRE